MLREAQIPFLLWLPAALLVHLLSGGSAFEVAQVENGKVELRAFTREVRDDVSASLQVVEVTFLDEEAKERPDETPPKDASSDDEEDEEAKNDPEDLRKAVPPPPVPPRPPVARVPPKPQPPKPKVAPKPKPKVEAPKPKPKAAPKPNPKPKAAPKPKPKPKAAPKPKPKAPEKKPQKLELPKPDGRIAVINDPALKKQAKDNPNAKRIADQANTVKEETMAKFRSYDQNASKPTGGRQLSPSDAMTPGNAAERAPGFSNEVKTEEAPPRAGSEGGPTSPERQPVARSPKAAGTPGRQGTTGRAGQKSVAPVKAGKGPAAPGAATAPGGTWSLSPEASGDGRPKRKGRKGRRGVAAIPGLPGGPRAGVLGPRYSISAFGLMEALGKKHLRREEQRARNTRLARHRGKFKTNQFEKYRAAIENYDPTVKPGNQTSLNAARVPFASYINRMHNRIHPIFADGFLGGLAALPPGDPLQDPKLSAHTEIVLDGQTGAVIRAGIVRTSGITAFDAGAIAAVHSAGPYGQPPEVIRSSDGNVYVHWEFYRDPFYACTSRFAAPYIVNVPKGAKATRPGPLRPIRKPTRERPRAGAGSKGEKKPRPAPEKRPAPPKKAPPPKPAPSPKKRSKKGK